MKGIVVLAVLLAVGKCSNDKDCIDPNAPKDVFCPQHYDPVCGCDGKTYSNSCMAGAAGVKKYTQGPCAEK